MQALFTSSVVHWTKASVSTGKSVLNLKGECVIHTNTDHFLWNKNETFSYVFYSSE